MDGQNNSQDQQQQQGSGLGGGTFNNLNRLQNKAKSAKNRVQAIKDKFRKKPSIPEIPGVPTTPKGVVKTAAKRFITSPPGIIVIIIIAIIIFVAWQAGSTSRGINFPESSAGPSPAPVPGDGTTDIPIPGLSLNKNAPVSVNNGENILYTITVSYSGREDIVVYDDIPSNTKFFSANPSAYTISNNGKRINWRLKEIPPTRTNESQGIDYWTFNLIVTPLASNIEPTNQAAAEIVSASTPASSTPSTGSTTPTNNTCGSTYAVGAKNINDGGQHNGTNFGDTTCELAETYPIDGNPPALLVEELKKLDPDNVEIWLKIIACEAPGYDPNNVSFGRAYGLFQMGGKDTTNGISYDRGDGNWRTQVSNAINYNNNLRSQGLEWQYWECADQCHLGLWCNSGAECNARC